MRVGDRLGLFLFKYLLHRKGPGIDLTRIFLYFFLTGHTVVEAGNRRSHTNWVQHHCTTHSFIHSLAGRSATKRALVLALADVFLPSEATQKRSESEKMF